MGARPLTSQSMDNIQDEIQDSNLEQEATPVVVEETAINSEAEDTDLLRKQIADLEEKNKQLYARVKKTEKSKETLPTNQSSLNPDERFERLELKTEGYNSEEVDFLMQNGGRKALENKIVVAGIEAMRQQAKSKNATPSGTGKSTIYQKYTEQDLKKMPIEELEKILPHA